MCGITGGIWTDPGSAVSPGQLAVMMDRLAHRGPDDEGTFFGDLRRRSPYEPQPGVALGFRRLAIIDLATGNQPLANEDETVWVVFNGEIYNYKTLRRRLEGAGHRFRTASDTETIVHLYEDEQLNCFSHLNGMFAIAIWDAPRRRLVLARDRLGQKPMVYHHRPDRLLFASELKSLLEVPDVSREIDPSAVDEYLTYQYVPHPNTIFRQIKKLPPGHYGVFHEGRFDVRPYWRPEFRRELAGSDAAVVSRVRETLASAVELRMQSDVPLGAFLSGGVDSSLIVALMQRRSDEPVKTFSIGFPVREYDETHFARRVAEHLGTEHHQFEVTPNGVDILPRLIWHFDEPMADSSAIPTWYVSELTRRHVTVALTGDGGDELFAGYPRYKAVSIAGMLDRHKLVKAILASRAWQWLPAPARQKSVRRRFKRFSEALRQPPHRRYLDWISIFNETRRAALYSDEFLDRLPNSDPCGFFQRALESVAGRDPISAISLADLTTYLPCDLMTKVDIASMAHSLECRQPMLDYRFVELVASLPVRFKYRRGRGKWLLRRAFGDLLPREIWRRKKMGFGVPLDHWFRHELRDMTRDVLLDDSAIGRGLFRREAVEQLVEQHARGEFDHSYRLWALLVLELWMRQWSDAPTSVPAAETVR